MVWFKVDDGFYTSRKVLSIPRRHRLAAIGLWTMSGNWSGRELTDGKVPDYVLDELGATETLIRALVEARLWLDRRSTDARPSADRTSPHIEFKNWSQYQPTRDDIEAERAAAAERQRKWRERNRSKTSESHVSNGVTDGVTDTVTNSAPTRPDPTRPEDKETASPARTRRKPETTLPESWEPNDNHREQARAGGIDIDQEAEAFAAHAQANDRRLRDWDAGFRMWLSKARPTSNLRALPGGSNGRPKRYKTDYTPEEWDALPMAKKVAIVDRGTWS